MRWIMHIHRVKIGKPETTSGRRRWNDIKFDLRERGFERVDSIDLAQDRDNCGVLVNTAIKLRAEQNFANFLSSSIKINLVDFFSLQAPLYFLLWLTFRHWRRSLSETSG
jgi:hypothetical protein